MADKSIEASINESIANEISGLTNLKDLMEYYVRFSYYDHQQLFPMESQNLIKKLIDSQISIFLLNIGKPAVEFNVVFYNFEFYGDVKIEFFIDDEKLLDGNLNEFNNFAGLTFKKQVVYDLGNLKNYNYVVRLPRNQYFQVNGRNPPVLNVSEDVYRFYDNKASDGCFIYPINEGWGKFDKLDLTYDGGGSVLRVEVDSVREINLGAVSMNELSLMGLDNVEQLGRLYDFDEGYLISYIYPHSSNYGEIDGEPEKLG